MRRKRLRPCVYYLIVLIPLTVLGMERYLGISLDVTLTNIKRVYYKNVVGIDLDKLPPPILDITSTSSNICYFGLHRMFDIHNPSSHLLNSRKIPKIVHQTAKSRCLTRNFEGAAVSWLLPGFSYYFHDDEAVDRLLQHHFTDFPLLNIVAQDCLSSRKAKIVFWKYLVLWAYGGIYVDINMVRTLNLSADTITFEDDGFFLLDQENQLLSSKFMAVSPRHPLMYYALRKALNLSSRADNLSSVMSARNLEVSALKEALFDFYWKKECKAQDDHTKSKSCVVDWKPKLYKGVDERTIRVAGDFEGYVGRVFKYDIGKGHEYTKMGMSGTTSSDHWNSSCFRDVLQESESVVNVSFSS